MLWKLSLSGIKSRLRDYLVLFSGLLLTSAIFYMFESLATNKEFLVNNSFIGSIFIIFQFGSVLLGIITFVYILYANSFLMSMRQKDYAMFMMLGAKGRKIAQMVFIETFLVGILATAIGSLLGVGLTSVVSYLLMNQLDLAVSKFSPFSLSGFIITIVFFVILFLLAAIVNASAIAKKPLLVLLNSARTPNRLKRNIFLLFIEAIAGCILLGIGYYVMAHFETYQLMGIGIALVTIVLGSYLVFHSIVIFCITMLKKSNGFALKGLNNFTLSQLSFRVKDYTQMLSMVSILFALALGALTVGLGFKNATSQMTNAFSAYDLVLNNAQRFDQKKIEELKPTLNVTYSMKEDETTVYFLKDEFDQQNLQVPNVNGVQKSVTKMEKYNGEQLSNDDNARRNLVNLELPDQQDKNQQLLSQTEFSQVNSPESKLQVIQVEDFYTVLPQIKPLVEVNKKNNPSLDNQEVSFSQKYEIYQLYNSLYSGIDFMGFFLGIAFLAMLASCLMFKILSGANSDTIRYSMLAKIGTRRSLLQASIRKEIGILFLLPGILGSIHVLFGLKMFATLLPDPYYRIWIPFAIFMGLYFVYYLVTTYLYTTIVMDKNKS